ncbi:MAG: hypothetical protein WAV48_05235 [Candidatus Magasanikiibacteriota bacterium]
MLYRNAERCAICELSLDQIVELVYDLKRWEFLTKIKFVFDEDRGDYFVEIEVKTDRWDHDCGSPEQGAVTYRLERGYHNLTSLEETEEDHWVVLSHEDRQTLLREIRDDIRYWAIDVQ